MAIRIVRNEQGNCINFYGSSNPTYWNACLSGEVDAFDTNTINVINDIITSETGVTQYEFFRVPYTEFVDVQGNGFTTPQEAADYITEKANVIGLGGGGTDLTDKTVCFKLDDTSTSIMLDNGYSFGVNTIKAISESGLIKIVSELGDIIHFINLDHTNVCDGEGDPISGGLNDVINYLNELFTVGAFEAVVISDPYSTMVANVNGENAGYTLEGTTSVDPIGDDIFSNSSSGNYAGLKSVATINQAGEYFTFDIRGEGQIGFGLIHTQESYDNGYFSGSSTYADPSTFAVSNSAHYGFQFSHWFHPTPNGSWTNYGANTSYSMRPGWSNWESKDDWLAGNPVKIKVGIDENGFISISSLQDDNTTWIVHARTSYPIPQGSEYHLGIKATNSSPRVYTAPKVHILDTAQAPTSLGTDAITVFGEGVTGTLAGGISSSATDGFDNDGFVSSQVINEVGEYFEFTWSAGGDVNFGLFSENDHDVSDLTSDTTSWGNDDYIFYGARMESNGAINSVYSENGLPDTSIGSGNDTSASQYYGRIGFDGQGRATIWYSVDGVNYTVYRHTQSAAPSGDYKFIWIAQEDGAIFDSLEQGVIDTAPTMYFRYIESPDGVFHYPIFATEEEADYYDKNHSGITGTGTHSTIVFPDDPTFNTWYIPTTGYVNDDFASPVGDLFQGNFEVYTEISSLNNQDLAPSAFDIPDYTVDELSNVNIQLAPQDVAYTLSVSGLPQGLILVGHHIEGSAPEVDEDYDLNPSDDYTITVTRTNSYGSASDTFVLTVTNLTAPVVAISGFNHVSGTTPLIDSGTMDDGSVVHVNNTVADGERFVIEKAYIETNILPNLIASGDQYIIGLHNTASDFSTLEIADFDAAIVWEYESASSHTFKFYRDGGLVQNIVIGSATQAFYDYAIEADGTSAWLIACNINSIMNEPSPSEGGQFSYTYEVTNTEDTAPLQIHMAALNTIGYISTDDIETITTPSTPTGILTNWSKALDFSGGSERAQQVTSDSNRIPIKMGGTNNQVSAPATSGNTTTGGHPWATAIVFKITTYNDNQHIWNLGEGAGTTDDNIYLRRSTDRKLYFGWGRSGDVSEMEIRPSDAGTGWNMTPGNWYGIYIAHNGTRYGSNNTTSLIADAFDIRLMGSSQSWATAGYSDTNLSVAADWTITGDGRMNRSYDGDMTIGGRGANRSFRGKIASMVITTLRPNVAMPTTAEIEMMITDPMQWLQDYKVGNDFRLPWQTSDAGFNFSLNDGSSAYGTQVWLMGDGNLDSYSNMIRNQVNPNDQNYTKLNMINMVSNDIQNVTISGLS